ncbi:hypothetical protein [Leifsonia sp. Leaf264]|uniref:hypothetical protein n=1 Tax=Leifsonia sp. Leaf264 TaxID=1736314 RepID=UPI0007017975|nr:hypothetical protein [Leifsonia sp. Leaf264]KQO98642.1 hypothetical protein ASF30_11305 [Leifsonia sp. Leaf264]
MSEFNAQHPRRNDGTKERTLFAVKDQPAGAPIDPTPTPQERIEATVEVQWMDYSKKPKNGDLRTGEATIGVDSYTSDEAPIAFVATVSSYRSDENGEPAFVPVQHLFREIDGELYGQHFEGRFRDNPVAVDAAWFERKAGELSYRGERSIESAARTAELRIQDFIAIDGQLWEKTREPAYQVITFGLSGPNSTSLSIVNAPHPEDNEDSWDDNVSDECYFPADQYEAAVEYALKVAEKRGDTGALGRIRGTVPIEITGGYKPGTVWTPAPRLDYVPVYDSRFGTADFAESLADFRRQLAELPGVVTRTDDGFGGTSVTIDYSKLTTRQAGDYKEYLAREEELRRLGR